LANGAPNIERVDKLVQSVAVQFGMQSDVDQTVAFVDGWLEKRYRRINTLFSLFHQENKEIRKAAQSWSTRNLTDFRQHSNVAPS
jgi:hypothetical protein